MKLALFSPPPMYRAISAFHRVRFGIEPSEFEDLLRQQQQENHQKNTFSQEEKISDTFNCGGQCQGRCHECSRGQTIRPTATLERMRKIFGKK